MLRAGQNLDRVSSHSPLKCLLARTLDAVYRRDVDNGAPVDNAAQLRSETVHGSRQVDRHDLVPLAVLHVGDGSDAVDLANDAGHVGGTVKPAVLLDDGLDPRVNV